MTVWSMPFEDVVLWATTYLNFILLVTAIASTSEEPMLAFYANFVAVAVQIISIDFALEHGRTFFAALDSAMLVALITYYIVEWLKAEKEEQHHP